MWPQRPPNRRFQSCSHILVQKAPTAVLCNLTAINAIIRPERCPNNTNLLYECKGDSSLPDNFRDISLLSITEKILAAIIARQLSANILSTGFYLSHNVAFAPKAFNSINCPTLWAILYKMGCLPTFITVVRLLHEGLVSRVSFRGCISEAFDIATGVKQGCTGPTVIHPVLCSSHPINYQNFIKRNLHQIQLGWKTIQHQQTDLAV